MTSQNITAQSLLAAIRAGRLTATLDPCETVPALASDTEQYPRAEILLQIDEEIIREITVWKYVYRCTGNDPMNGQQILPQGSWKTRTASSDGATRGTPSYEIETREDDKGNAWPVSLVITTGEGCGPVEGLDLTGITEEEAEEIAQEIGDMVEAAYSDWTPETPSDEELFEALTSNGAGVRSLSVSVNIGEASDSISLEVYGANHLGQPIFAVQGDEEEEVYDDAREAFEAAGAALRQALRLAEEELGKLDFADLAQELRAELEA